MLPPLMFGLETLPKASSCDLLRFIVRDPKLFLNNSWSSAPIIISGVTQVWSPLSLVKSGRTFHSAMFSLCMRSHAWFVNSFRAVDLKGLESVGWAGRSVTAVRGARSSKGQSVIVQRRRFLSRAAPCRVLLTLKMNRRVRVSLSRSGDCVLDMLVVVVAVDAVTVFVDERRVATYYGSLVSCMFNVLSMPISILCW